MSDEPVILEMFGDDDAGLCVDGVCAVPETVGLDVLGADEGAPEEKVAT